MQQLVQPVAHAVSSRRDAAIGAGCSVCAAMQLHVVSATHLRGISWRQIASTEAMLWPYRVVGRGKWTMVRDISAVGIILAVRTIGTLVVARNKLIACVVRVSRIIRNASHCVCGDRISARIESKGVDGAQGIASDVAVKSSPRSYGKYAITQSPLAP
jgi:hypothetical protein